MKMRGLIFLGVLSFVLFGCEPIPDTASLVKDMAVQTNYDKSAIFSAYSTYHMKLDTIGQVYNVDPADTLIVGEFGKMISRQVKANLDQAGYNWVEPNQNPDLAINVFVVRDYNVYQTISYGGPFYGYPGYYYPGFYGYGGFSQYPFITTYASNTATLIIEMVDLKNVDPQNKVKVVWVAYAGDLITSADTFTKSKEAVDQAFVQSPYLIKGAL